MAPSILDIAPPKADRRLAYGGDPQQFVDLRFPGKPEPWPVVLNLHGGFWRAAYDLAHAGHFCAALTEAGYCTANIEYRRAGNAGGGWPGTLEDIRNAYAYIRLHARELGCDPERLLVTGHSAGGHLAVCLAAHEPTVTRVVALAGVLDLQRAYDLHLSKDAVVEFLGGTPEQVPDNYVAASPKHRSVKAHQMVITGTADADVPPQFSKEYAHHKTSQGENVELVEIAGADHFDLIDPRTNAFAVVLREFRKLTG